MVSVNGNGNVNNDFGINNPYVQSAKQGKVTIGFNPDNKYIGEFGDKLLEQVQPAFVKRAQLPEEAKVELNEMFQMAGIKNPKMPTIAQYESVAGHVKAFGEAMDDFTTTNHAERLFNSDDFSKLNELFGLA